MELVCQNLTITINQNTMRYAGEREILLYLFPFRCVNKGCKLNLMFLHGRPKIFHVLVYRNQEDIQSFILILAICLFKFRKFCNAGSTA